MTDTRRADLIDNEASLLPAPGVGGSKSARDVLLKDPFVREALALFPKITMALAGKGAVGDICLRFFDAAGRQVITELNDRVISMELAQLRTVPTNEGGAKETGDRSAM